MLINENDRLDLRQALVRVFEDQRLADIAMEAMPPINYSELATKADLHALEPRFAGIDARFTAIDARFDAVDARFDAVDARFLALDGKIDRVHGALDLKLAQQLRTIMLMQIGTLAAVIGVIQASV